MVLRLEKILNMDWELLIRQLRLVLFIPWSIWAYDYNTSVTLACIYYITWETNTGQWQLGNISKTHSLFAIFFVVIQFWRLARKGISPPYFPTVPSSTRMKCEWLLSRHAPSDSRLGVMWYVTTPCEQKENRSIVVSAHALASRGF